MENNNFSDEISFQYRSEQVNSGGTFFRITAVNRRFYLESTMQKVINVPKQFMQ